MGAAGIGREPRCLKRCRDFGIDLRCGGFPSLHSGNTPLALPKRFRVVPEVVPDFTGVSLEMRAGGGTRVL
jgi:hypothetical protein